MLDLGVCIFTKQERDFLKAPPTVARQKRGRR